ncbi:nicotinate-nucleotide--dimethylbenzimidazole phosphoribosyltransferase [Mesorhizobium sp. BAC0120]|uniref:nicotinate-nucleotide--dimethylbenzimidazole phosphoribosyltransferase n=1 Tax=Mesorhizobium sp. BAC0120 TaxID=3090670 RepID=UPI00298C5262|nr:nicotinate-nucleotide--dimethylbenzimidazole phosphoribosyltransferase [Mesorhizobium sp. BAC0120]MDW6023673.1 nicotinate-nucleotide--dimethylbenzimidazole phosphoribosyltransferase [Mesorhizobium sp. BAC0120]
MNSSVAAASGLPFDDFRSLLANLPPLDRSAAVRVRDDFARMDKPARSLGRIEGMAMWLAACTGRMPAVTRPVVAIFAGNHGAARHGISPRPIEATQRLVELAAAGGAAINQLCIAYDLGLKLYDLALELPTADFTADAALDERATAATMAFGMEAVAGGVDLIALGDIGVGGSTAAAAIAAALFGGGGADWVGPGSGADTDMIARKAEIVDRGLALHAAHLKDPLEVLARFGGREFAAIAGAILAARMENKAVILDGFTSTAAAAVLQRVNPAALDHCLLAHVSSEPGHRKLAGKLGLKPLLNFGLGHGEGTGAAIAAGIVKAAALVHSGMTAALPK